MGVEPTTLGFGNQRSTIGAIASNSNTLLPKTRNPFRFLIILTHYSITKIILIVVQFLKNRAYLSVVIDPKPFVGAIIEEG